MTSTLRCPPTLSFDSLSRVDAAARFGFASSASQNPFPTVLVSVSGPIAPTLSQEKPNKSTLEVLVRPLSNVPGTQEKYLASILSSVLECSILGTANPRTLIQVVVQVLVPQGRYTGVGGVGIVGRDKVLASMINASTLTMLNASSIPMRGVVCAVVVGRKSKSGSTSSSSSRYVVDPADEESSSLDASGCFAFLFSDVLGKKTVNAAGSTCLWTSWRCYEGGIDEAELKEAKSVALEGAKEIWGYIRNLVGKREGLEVRMAEDVKESHEDASEQGDDDKMEI
ncbi:hypothetical protein D9758_011339 [Tetrapyrgos nigripes]|uniref:Exoribonuclease phosphorolytic domain-containing protein n=1 Tax=Tetrapyrgos nigripes TaxID=182062 RepID=A0A8H5G875_9AGAR|nr:hypothetical protein D9758_011339 [Tetrapyrgos nigripes]